MKCIPSLALAWNGGAIMVVISVYVYENVDYWTEVIRPH
jgi:hypothetical protein